MKKMNKCKSLLQFPDDFGDNECTFHCELPQGHLDRHRESGILYDKCPYSLEWECPEEVKIMENTYSQWLGLDYGFFKNRFCEIEPFINCYRTFSGVAGKCFSCYAEPLCLDMNKDFEEFAKNNEEVKKILFENGVGSERLHIASQICRLFEPKSDECQARVEMILHEIEDHVLKHGYSIGIVQREWDSGAWQIWWQALKKQER